MAWLSDSVALVTGGHWSTSGGTQPASVSSLPKSASAPVLNRPPALPPPETPFPPSATPSVPAGPPHLRTQDRSAVWRQIEKDRIPSDPGMSSAARPASVPKTYSSLGVFAARPEWRPHGFTPSLTFSESGRAPPMRSTVIPSLLPPPGNLSYTPPPPSDPQAPATAPPIPEERRCASRRPPPDAFGSLDVIDWLKQEEANKAAKRVAREQRTARARAKRSEPATPSERVKRSEPPEFIKAVHARERQRTFRFEEERNPDLYVHRGRAPLLTSVWAEPHLALLPPRPYIWQRLDSVEARTCR